MVKGYRLYCEDFETGVILVGLLEDTLENLIKDFPGQRFELELVMGA